jgi:hypothetical protein
MTLPKPPLDLNVIVAHEYVNQMAFGAKRWYARAFLEYLTGKQSTRPGCGQVSMKDVVDIQAKLRELLK